MKTNEENTNKKRLENQALPQYALTLKLFFYFEIK